MHHLYNKNKQLKSNQGVSTVILGSCLGLKLSYYGCCKLSLSQQCSHNGCYCDQFCHKWNYCCSDISDIGCHSTTTPTSTGKTY